jgi:ectoine hydroxylase-related dioxygenase (phytanoyl-CoA dioxygenase family)
MGLDLASRPLIDLPDVTDQVASGAFGPYGQQALEMAQQGFCLLDLADDSFRERADVIRDSFEPQFDLDGWRNGSAVDLRLQDGWKQCAAVRELALHAVVLELLRYLYGREPFCFQTLNFPVGSQQHFHSDAVHFHSYPHGFMCGVWMALEAIEADAGPLVYYPGSHRLPYRSAETEGLRPEDVAAERHPQRLFEPIWRRDVQAHGLQPETYLPRQGQVLVWHANLLHGGLPVKNRQRTRWSQVNHFFFADCLYTTPMHSFDFSAGGACLRQPQDVATGQPRSGRAQGIMVPHR